MKEIKFRGKRVDNDDWVYGDLVHTKHFTYILDINFVPAKSLPAERFIEILPETVGQYTGLKDKNGVEIYEGDKVKITDENFKGQTYERNATIVYSDSKGSYHAEGTNCDHLGDFIIDIYGKNISKVIGNIHDKN